MQATILFGYILTKAYSHSVANIGTTEQWTHVYIVLEAVNFKENQIDACVCA